MHAWVKALSTLIELVEVLSWNKILLLHLASIFARSSHLRLHVIVSRFHINSFVINVVSSVSIRVDLKESILVLLGFLLVLKLHFDEAKASASLRGSISHDDGVSDNPILFEIGD